jgi:vacuolar-type H+-ATPase subunit E/Vma4
MWNGVQLDRLLSELEARSRGEIDGVLADARARAAAVRRDAENKRAMRREAALTACEQELAVARRLSLAKAHARARARLLAAQQALVARVLDSARALGPLRLAAVSDEVLRARLAELLAFVDTRGGGATLYCHPTILSRLASMVPAEVRVHEDPTLGGGIRLLAEDGRVTVEDTLEAWFERERGALAQAICRRAAEEAA